LARGRRLPKLPLIELPMPSPTKALGESMLANHAMRERKRLGLLRPRHLIPHLASALAWGAGACGEAERSVKRKRPAALVPPGIY
jgi:hypothetical protein